MYTKLLPFLLLLFVTFIFHIKFDIDQINMILSCVTEHFISEKQSASDTSLHTFFTTGNFICLLYKINTIKKPYTSIYIDEYDFYHKLLVFNH